MVDEGYGNMGKPVNEISEMFTWAAVVDVEGPAETCCSVQQFLATIV